MISAPPMTTETELTTGQKLYLILSPLVLSLGFVWLSGDWWWVQGWLFALWLFALSVVSIAYLYRKDPALLRERFNLPGAAGEKRWDKYWLSALMMLFLAWFVVIPLEARRFAWTAGFPPSVEVIGAVLLLPSFFFLYRAYTDNTFLSPVVRIQTERRQRVVSTGVYGFVRHPMYLGGICMILGVPLLAGSLCGLGLGLVLTLMIAGRIIGEERMLTDELEGYVAYKQKVKFRLVPFIW